MARVPKHIALELIQYVKKVDIKANYWDERARSAFEFARQIDSPRLKKINPAFEVNFVRHTLPDAPTLTAEYADGSKWSIETTSFKLDDIRADFFARAADAEDIVGDTVGGAAAPAGAVDAKKDAGKKGGAKPAAKK